MLLRIIGRTFIAAGVLILLFLAYQLFGTNFVTKQNQRALAAQFAESLDDPTLRPAPDPEPDLGDGVARIQIPKIGVDWIVVEGVSVEALKKGPGHYPDTPFPGEVGNVVISGHRTTYGAPFFRLDEVGPGDTIRLVSRTGSYRYDIAESKVVRPTDLSVIQPTQDPRLTLTTCTPRFSARQRLIVIAKLVDETSEREAA